MASRSGSRPSPGCTRSGRCEAPRAAKSAFTSTSCGWTSKVSQKKTSTSAAPVAIRAPAWASPPAGPCRSICTSSPRLSRTASPVAGRSDEVVAGERACVGLSMDDPVWDVTVFTKNRERLLRGDPSRLASTQPLGSLGGDFPAPSNPMEANTPNAWDRRRERKIATQNLGGINRRYAPTSGRPRLSNAQVRRNSAPVSKNHHCFTRLAPDVAPG